MARIIYISPERRPKPHGPYAVGGVYEHDVCCEIAALEKMALERCGFEVVIAPPASTMEERVTWANANGVDYYQTLHSNGANGTATGAECLYYNHYESIKANQFVYDELVKLYPSKRDVKNGTSYFENNMTNMVSCYPEIGFHDNPSDARFILNNKQQIAEALAKGVCRYFDVAYVPVEHSAPATQSSEVEALRAERDKLQRDNAVLATRITELESKLKQINQLSA